MSTKNYNVQILVDGKPVKEYTKDSRVFVEARTGTEYSIRLKNNTAKRALAIISIDGINVVSGKIAAPEDTGYVIGANSSMTVEGFRQDDQGGGKFKFTVKETGYATEIDGTGVNSGVIGVIFVEEKVPEPTYVTKIVHHYHEREKRWDDDITPFTPKSYPWWGTTWCGNSGDLNGGGVLRSMNNINAVATSLGDTGQSRSIGMGSVGNYCSTLATDMQCCAQATSFSLNPEPVEVKPEFDRATTWGNKYVQPVEYVAFTRSETKTKIDTFYASAEALKAMGVIKESKPQITFPESFTGFARPPKNWNN